MMRATPAPRSLQVREIMKDLAGIVVEQGQMITTVESHAERANDDAKAAVAESLPNLTRITINFEYNVTWNT